MIEVLYLFLATVPFFGKNISDWRGFSTIVTEKLPNHSIVF